MSQGTPLTDPQLKATILELLDENRIMSVATVRADGWPQATMVGYAHDNLTLYFAVARDSQKFANIQRDPRVSIAIGRDNGDRILGLSMAARVAVVSDGEEVERLNDLLTKHYPQEMVFAPRELSAVLMRATPEIISVINLAKGPGQVDLVLVTGESTVERLVHPSEPS